MYVKKVGIIPKNGIWRCFDKNSVSQSKLFSYEDRVSTPRYSTVEKIVEILGKNAIEIIEMS